MDHDRQHCDDDVDEAIEVIRAAKDPTPTGGVPITVDRRPWWHELRGALYLLGGSFLALTISLAALTVLLLRADQVTEQSQRRSLCQAVLTAQVSAAASSSRQASSSLLAEVGRQLIDPEADRLDRDPLVEALSALDVTNEQDRVALEQRNVWLAAGRPLPCPVSTNTDFVDG